MMAYWMILLLFVIWSAMTTGGPSTDEIEAACAKRGGVISTDATGMWTHRAAGTEVTIVCKDGEVVRR